MPDNYTLKTMQDSFERMGNKFDELNRSVAKMEPIIANVDLALKDVKADVGAQEIRLTDLEVDRKVEKQVKENVASFRRSIRMGLYKTLAMVLPIVGAMFIAWHWHV